MRQRLVQCGERSQHVGLVAALAHVPDADDLVGQHVKAAGDEYAVYLEHSIQYRGVAEALGDVDDRHGVGVAVFTVERKPRVGHGAAHRRCNAGVPLKDVLILEHIVQRAGKAVDVAGRHGVGEPLVFPVVLVGQQVAVEARHGRLARLHGRKRSGRDRHHRKARRAGQRFLRAAAQDIYARGVHVHLVAEHAGHRVHHGQQAVFLENGAQRVDVVEHAAGRVAVHERGVLKVVIL